MILTCRQLVERASDARDHRLSAVDRVGWVVHLGWCARCRRFVRQLDHTIDTLAAMPTPPSPTALRQALVERLTTRRD